MDLRIWLKGESRPPKKGLNIDNGDGKSEEKGRLNKDDDLPPVPSPPPKNGEEDMRRSILSKIRFVSSHNSSNNHSPKD